MPEWSKIGLVSSDKFEEQMQHQEKQLEELKALIIESNKINQQNIDKLCTEVISTLQTVEKNISSSVKKSRKELNVTLEEELRSVKEHMSLIEEALKLNWTNQLLNQLEANLAAHKK